MASNFRPCVTTLLFILLFLPIMMPVVLSKNCKKIDACKCEMDDGSGVINLWDLDNPDGTPRFTNIPDKSSGRPSYTYSFNPCTPIKSTGKDAVCTGSNLCQKDSLGSKTMYYPCDGSGSSFTVDVSDHVVMTFKPKTYTDKHTRFSKIILVCNKNDKKGSFGKGVSEASVNKTEGVYSATLYAKSACLVTKSSSLSTGSILLIIFFPLVLLYLVIGILFNTYVRHKQSVPEVLPNHTFWADFPFLVKDGCVFSCGKMKHCCGVFYAKVKGQHYTEI